MSKRRKIKPEEKIRIAKACISGTMSLNAAAEQLGVHQSMVDHWARLYQTEGTQAFLPRTGNRRYDPVLKEAAVKDYLSGKGSIREICKRYKIRSTYQHREWIMVYNGHKDFKKQTGGSRNGQRKRNYPSRESRRSKGMPRQRQKLWRSSDCVQCQLPAGPELDPEVHRGWRIQTKANAVSKTIWPMTTRRM